MSTYRGALAFTAWAVLSLIEHVLVGFAVLAALGAVVLLLAAGWYGRRLWLALHELDERVGSLESIVKGERG